MKPHDPRMRLGGSLPTLPSCHSSFRSPSRRCLQAYSSNEESAARYLHVFGLDQLDLLGDRPCADRFWLQSPRYLRAMALLENTQKAGRGDPGIDTAPPNRNRAPKQGECRRGFKVPLAPIEHPRFGQMRLICAKSLWTDRAPNPYNEPCVGCCGAPSVP